MSGDFCKKTRREFLWEAGAGFTGLGLTGMLSADGFFPKEAKADAEKRGKAKAVIFLYMYGGPSQVDTFDYRPELVKNGGKTVPIKSFREAGKTINLPLMAPKWPFKPYGKSGKMVSDLFPHVGECVDDIAFLHGCFSDSAIHGSAMLQMNTGKIISGSPSLGSWVNYGMGDREEPAGLRGHGGLHRWAYLRRKELEQRLHARQVPGRRSPRGRRPDSGPLAARWYERRDAAGHAGHSEQPERRPCVPQAREHRPGCAYRQLRAGLRYADQRPGSGGYLQGV
ncbi:MAG: DUF1501 domain-containing protein [Armatimonas sp.]